MATNRAPARCLPAFEQGDEYKTTSLRWRRSQLAKRLPSAQQRHAGYNPMRPLWVKGGCRSQVDGTPGLPSAPEMRCAPGHLRLVPIADPYALRLSTVCPRSFTSTRRTFLFGRVRMASGSVALRQ